MKKTIKTALAGLLMVPVLTFGVSLVATTPDANAQINKGLSASNVGTSGQTQNVEVIIKNIINIMLYVVGAAAVIMLIWGGIRYTTSGGNQAAVTSAKNTILYAIIGLVIAIFAFAIVNFVVLKTT